VDYIDWFIKQVIFLLVHRETSSND
jgi:hypothetical protein